MLGAFGKQRRTLELDEAISVGAYCDPLFGAKGGVEIEVAPNFVIAPAVGVAVNLDEGDRTSLFGEVELNRKIGAGFIGTGVGVWDITHSDNVTPHLLIHAGAPLVKTAEGRGRLLFVVEGRLFFDQIDNVENNYQAWAGVRYLFR